MALEIDFCGSLSEHTTHPPTKTISFAEVVVGDTERVPVRFAQNNYFSGQIPQQLTAVTTLDSLDLSVSDTWTALGLTPNC